MSNTEKEFVRAVIAEKYRLDGRGPREYRSIKIRYEGSKGCCFVDLGETKVVAQISWELSTPKDSRPNEGMVRVNVELSPLMGSFAAIPNSAPTTDDIIEVNRLLERCLRESNCLDLESLCIESGTSAMTIKVDLHVLNHSGNLIDALMLAGIGALKHFRKPDVTYCGLETIVHTNEDRDPLPLNLLHIPVCTTFAFFSLTSDSTVVIMDPTDLEEKCCDWKVIIAANKQREICLMQTLGSRALTTADQILLCCNLAIERAIQTAHLIERSLKEDE
uniref:Exosome complex component RRP45 n=1 Tax=Helobdella robusta TaxID=6412 RepID=T1EHY8_HELRO